MTSEKENPPFGAVQSEPRNDTNWKHRGIIAEESSHYICLRISRTYGK